MAELIIRPDLVAKLRQRAERENQSVDELIESFLKSDLESISTDEEIPPPGTLARLAWAARQIDFHSDENDIADRSREILNEEFPEYLMRYRQDDEE